MRSREYLLNGFDVQLRKTRWFSRSYGVTWGWWRWTPARVSMVSGRLHVSETTGTYQISPYWIELRGFKQIVVYGIDDEDRNRSLIIKFSNVDDSWKFGESVPGLRWTYWDPTGRLEALPIKNKLYRRTYQWVLSGVAAVVLVGLFLWVTLNSLYTGIFGILLLFPLHLISLPFGQKRQQQKKGHLLVEAGKVVITTGNVVWFDPVLSDRRAWNPKRLLVRSGKTTLQIEFANKHEAGNGSRLMQRNFHGLQGLVGMTQAA